ncbi:MAG: stage III sporulation protein AG [Oscillospiraceae bacterium]|nr:stage III sporulation protein AG [Oscillospiraceae bacterium]
MKSGLLGILKNKYALIVLAAGLILILWPGSSKKEETPATELTAPAFSITDEETRLASQLSRIKGAGKVSVLLSVKGSASRELAEGEEGTLVVSENGKERVVDLYYVNPDYLGAVIVCEGADSAEVRLKVSKAVAVYTGLGMDEITVLSMQNK